jgi:hypothetical protein
MYSASPVKGANKRQESIDKEKGGGKIAVPVDNET